MIKKNTRAIINISHAKLTKQSKFEMYVADFMQNSKEDLIRILRINLKKKMYQQNFLPSTILQYQLNSILYSIFPDEVLITKCLVERDGVRTPRGINKRVKIEENVLDAMESKYKYSIYP